LNGKQIDGTLMKFYSIRTSAKFEAFDWDVDIKEGNNQSLLWYDDAKSRTGKGNQFVSYCILKWVTELTL
jgi:hypothetical protein